MTFNDGNYLWVYLVPRACCWIATEIAELSNLVNFDSKPRHLTCSEKSRQRADPMISRLVWKNWKGTTKFSVRKKWDRPPPVQVRKYRPKQKWNVNSHSILTLCSPSTHLIGCALQVSTWWALQKGNGEQNISWVSDVYWVSNRWALGEYWHMCLRRVQ